MFPWNYGFHWSATSYIFLGAFYTCVIVVVATVISAIHRSHRALQADETEGIRWNSDFHDLPASDRVCRHVLTGEFRSRQCPHGFDCRQCATHARLVELHPQAQPEAPGEELFGMHFPLDRHYHRGHAWARPESDGTVTVGLDELGWRLLGAPDGVDLPKPGTQVHVNGTAFRLRKRNANVRVLAPVDGEVVETGSPERGWYLKLKPAGPMDLRHLLTGAEVKPWLMREMERLQLTLSLEGAAPALADGGVPVSDIAANYPDADWDAVCGEMFLEP